MFLSFVFNQIYYTNVFYYYAKTILPYNLSYTFQNLYFSGVLIISLISINTFRIFTLFVLIKVESNSLNIFSRISAQVVYKIFIYALLAIVLIVALFSSLIVGNNSNIVYYGFSNNKLNRLRFLFVQIRQLFYSIFNFFLSIQFFYSLTRA